MSAPAIAWAIEQGCVHKLTPALRLLLQYLADQADATHECKPGQERIRKYTGLSLSTIRTGGQRLARKRLIAIEEYAGMATQYTLNIVTNGEDPASEPPQTVTGYPHKPSQGTPTIGDGVTPPNSYRVPGATPTNGAGVSRARTPSSEKEEREEGVSEERGERGAGERGAQPLAPPKRGVRAHQLPNSWAPNTFSVSLATELGFSMEEIRTEAEAMRDWAIHAGKPGHDWDRRFNNWLRKAAKDRYIRNIRTRRQPTLAETFGLKSFLLDDEMPPEGRLQ